MTEKIYTKDGKLDIDLMLNNGWHYRDFPWVQEELFIELEKLLTETEFMLIVKTEMVETNIVNSTKKVRGQFLISDEGLKKLKDWVEMNALLITHQTSDHSANGSISDA